LKAGADFAGVELIDDQGRKSTPYGTAAKGAYWSPEPLPDGDGADRRVLIGEGVATMLSARQALPGDVCIAARFAGNLPAVAEAMRNRYPQARLVILGERGGGWRFAERAARVCGGLLADFTGDANDLHKLQGLDAVRVVIGAAQEPTEDALQDAQSGSDTPTDQPARLNGSKGALASLVEPVAHLRRGDEIKLQPVRWLMPDFLPCGKVVLIGGQPGTGKTTAAIALAAAVSCGGRFPDGSRPEAADVLLWSGEDSIDDTLAGRFKAAGADMSRVHFVDGVDVGLSEPRYFDPAQDVGSLRAAVDKLKAANPAFNPRVVIVDPIVSAVQGDSHKNSEVRRALQPLVDFADRSGAVVLGITHFSKGTQGREPIERITGSLAFAALARVVLVCAKMDEAEGGGRVLVRSKNNLGKDGGGFRYDLGAVEVEPGITASRVLWGDPIEGTAREILATAEDTQDATDRGETQSAAEWLRATLEGGELTKLQVMERGREAGFSDRTLQRARQRIGAKAEVVGFGTQKRSIWRMPEGAPETEPARQSCQPAPIHANPKAGANGHVWDAVGTHGAVEVLDGPPWEPPGDPKPADAEAL
jgi:putative DNA primase/helicase